MRHLPTHQSHLSAGCPAMAGSAPEESSEGNLDDTRVRAAALTLG